MPILLVVTLNTVPQTKPLTPIPRDLGMFPDRIGTAYDGLPFLQLDSLAIVRLSDSQRVLMLHCLSPIWRFVCQEKTDLFVRLKLTSRLSYWQQFLWMHLCQPQISESPRRPCLAALGSKPKDLLARFTILRPHGRVSHMLLFPRIGIATRLECSNRAIMS